MDSTSKHQIQKHTHDSDYLPDERLVVDAQHGSNAAFGVLIERHYHGCYKLAHSILRAPEDAEDEVQNACWKAFAHIRQFQQDAKFSTWLTRIVVNQCLMRLRQAGRARFAYLDETVAGEDSLRLELADVREGPERDMGTKEVAAVLANEIRRIPPLLRRAFILRDVEERSMQEVAEELGISVAAAKRLLRARLELRKRMDRHAGRLGVATLLA